MSETNFEMIIEERTDEKGDLVLKDYESTLALAKSVAEAYKAPESIADNDALILANEMKTKLHDASLAVNQRMLKVEHLHFSIFEKQCKAIKKILADAAKAYDKPIAEYEEAHKKPIDESDFRKIIVSCEPERVEELMKLLEKHNFQFTQF